MQTIKSVLKKRWTGQSIDIKETKQPSGAAEDGSKNPRKKEKTKEEKN